MKSSNTGGALNIKLKILELKKYKYETVNLIVGAVVLTFELVASRVVAPYIGTTIYVWTSIIGVILASLAIGYGIGGYIADKRHNSDDVIFLLFLGAILISIVDFTKDWVLKGVAGTSINLQWQALIASILLFALPTIVLGAISPYLVRLSIKSVSTSGRQVARINAAGTVGALIGTFLTGYFLFGLIGTRNILALLAIVLCLASFIVNYKLLDLHRLLIVFIILLFTLSPSQAQIGGLVKDLDTRYGRILVRDVFYNHSRVRVMQTDGLTWQSGVNRTAGNDLVFAYTNAFALAAQKRPDAKKILIIGGGAFSFPGYLAKLNPEVQIDVVEIDSTLTSISRQYFDFNPTKNVKIIEADGRQFLNLNVNKYDLIFMDVYSSLIPPFQLFTKEAVARVKSSLTDKGLVIVNLVSLNRFPGQQLIVGSIKTYQQIFKNVGVFEADVDRPVDSRQNLLILASEAGIPDSLGKLPTYYPGSKDKLFGKKLSFQTGSVKSFTDDFAPVENMALNNSH